VPKGAHLDDSKKSYSSAVAAAHIYDRCLMWGTSGDKELELKYGF